jgi:hypothetical protein
LNTPPAGGTRSGVDANRYPDTPAGRDSLRPSSGNLDYLLEDEEEPKRGGGKLILGVLALALAVGFGYLHFKQGGFDWLKASQKKTAATTDTVQNGADSGSAPGTTTIPAATNPAVTNPDNAAPQAGSAAPASSGAATNPTDANAPQTTAQQSDSQTTPPQATAPLTHPDNSKAPAEPASSSASASSDSDKEAPPTDAPAQPRARAAKPAAGRPGDSVNEAERYIYGRGVRQDCDRGVRMLKAEQSNPKAMISLGALYSTGTCTPRDLPTAYRWFAGALHKQPDNQALQDDLQKLWSRMTQPERQLAIKLSQ